MRLEGIIDHTLRRRIVRNEQQIIPKMLRKDVAEVDTASMQAATPASASSSHLPAGTGPGGGAPWLMGCVYPVPAAAYNVHALAQAWMHWQASLLHAGHGYYCWAPVVPGMAALPQSVQEVPGRQDLNQSAQDNLHNVASVSHGATQAATAPANSDCTAAYAEPCYFMPSAPPDQSSQQPTCASPSKIDTAGATARQGPRLPGTKKPRGSVSERHRNKSRASKAALRASEATLSFLPDDVFETSLTVSRIPSCTPSESDESCASAAPTEEFPRVASTGASVATDDWEDMLPAGTHPASGDDDLMIEFGR